MNPVILLHGALGTSDQLKPLADILETDQPIHLMNFEAHGTASIPDRPFRMENFTENVLKYMDERNLEKVHLFGYSMGGYVAMYLARYYPERVEKISTLGTVLKWNSSIAEREVKFLNPDKIKLKVPKFAEELNKRHPAGWQKVTLKTKDLLLDLGKNPRIKDREWSEITHNIRIHVGDSDSTAGLQQSIEVYNELQNGELTVLPDTPHPIGKVNLKLLAVSLDGFFDTDS
ncbi:alpha/beta fold hydrolase [Gracilimonas sp. Q87]|uniref:alpha/beta fold hydrolase n=1 Tax=Gracilimonas sp. Q87 TaxID=3384766 RepID=UPI0039841DE8